MYLTPSINEVGDFSLVPIFQPGPNPVAEFKFVALHFGIIRFGIRLSEIVDLKYWIFWAQLFHSWLALTQG